MLKNLKDFANAIFDAVDWPDGFALDGADFQEIAVKNGLLVPETRYEPCGEHCNCLEYYTREEMALGVTCYRKAEWLNADVDTRSPTLHEAKSGGAQVDDQDNKRTTEIENGK